MIKGKEYAPAEDLRYTLDPVAFAQKELGFELDQWQKDVLHSRSKKKVFNCARQSGKSTVAAIKSLHRALFYPGSLIILISPSQRQSSELFRKVTELLRSLKNRPRLTEDNKLSLTLENGSRIISLPSNEDTIRGYSAVDLVIEDEASRVPDEIYKAVRPMLAVSNGEYNQLSTPNGKHGHFWDAWIGAEWEKVTFTAADNPRISEEFLEGERIELGTRMFGQEYLCLFLEDQEGNIIRREWWKSYDMVPLCELTIQSWDTAFKEGTLNDFSVCTTWGRTQSGYYLIDRWKGKVAFPDLKKVAMGLYTKHHPDAVLIEDKASGQSLIQEFERGTSIPVIPVSADRDKVARANAVAPLIESGRVFLPQDAEWLFDYLEELTAFPNVTHDDQVDSTTHALAYLKRDDSSDQAADKQAKPMNESRIPEQYRKGPEVEYGGDAIPFGGSYSPF